MDAGPLRPSQVEVAIVGAGAGEDDVHGGAGAGQVAGDDQAIATVMAGSNQEQHLLAGDGSGGADDLGGDGGAGDFHELWFGDAGVDGRLLQRSHLGDGGDVEEGHDRQSPGRWVPARRAMAGSISPDRR